MKKIILLLTLWLTAPAVFAQNNFFTDNLLFTAKLNGDFFSPQVSTNASGIATLTMNSTHDSICVSIIFNNIDIADSLTGIGIYYGVTAADSQFVDLFPFLNGNRIATMLSGNNVSAENILHYFNGDFSLLATNGNNT